MPTVNNDDNLIDKKVYDELLKYVPKEELIELYKEYILELNNYLKKLRTAVTENNILEILSTLHIIKGSSASLGLKDIAEYSEKVESNIKREGILTDDDFLTEFRKFFYKFANNYERLIKQ
ncbi:MAG: HPt (histidine-containing phosphotransfer) domain-containing protein [Roseivirga sp.]|jgi:HPt (histidine-containing phosphotransfer) domain-containing protein